MNTDALAEARGWVKDVVGNPDDVDDATDTQVTAYVNRHYQGAHANGWDGFLQDTRGAA